ncbi:Protein MK0488 [Desulfarculales bacterium]
MTDDRDITVEEQKRLLAVARQTIETLVEGQRPVAHSMDLDGLSFQRGAFVTLHRREQLRGCIGNFTSPHALVRTVEKMAVAAASQDPRFMPVRPSEMPEIDLEISVLSPLKPIKDISEIEVGRHGIYIINPRGRGVLLPQVATEQGWDRDTFLEHICLKAGLQPGCWQDLQTQVLVFSAQVFGEKELLNQA